ncbi:alpha/beta fold hydrolase [Bradyrhizobium sp. AUGA SZCCT0042]|uniref:alpha/beta fold hydrolase n=1 Tax=Bradyrhizobium sp. AUGA SZCCT0042 TaxID=2807651 RepID=UPI001BA9930A|nr:alpha/beta fold hydrolase [Bradyrhizobium sp. AUGA SZCCT0042]MBR1301269.1 alpha/beta fold hydrolase [Bradyrhizobium sp. AUGA SZCCT0042]
MTKFLHDSSLAANSLADDAARQTLALNPLVSLRTEDFVEAANTFAKAAMSQPKVAVEQWWSFARELANVTNGVSSRAPESGDKRFNDPAWKSSPIHQKMLQSYLAWGNAVNEYVGKINLGDQDRARAKLFSQIVVDAFSPTNSLVSNPAALKKVVDSGGQSLVSGFKNYVEDLVKNGGMPSQVDTTPFQLGKNVATTPGAVVFRNEIFELIQYMPMTSEVWQRPLVIVPPQINKYYSLDLSPEKSMVQFLLKQGIQLFCISWRNPTAEHRDWGLDNYVMAVDVAVDTAKAITGSPDVSLMGACSGGITSSAYVGWLATKGEHKVKNLVLPVCMLDPSTADDTALGPLVTPRTVEAARQSSRQRGVLDGDELAKVFAWMRPNDLIWNYWVNNYLLGNAPPAFDILFWNGDTTSLPARLHSDYLDLFSTNPFRNAGALSILGTPIDIQRVKLDTYVVAGVTDHITPWKSVYQTARILGEETTFVLSNAGHLQSLLNPPGNPKSTFVTGAASQSDTDAFLLSAKQQTGSWWLHWNEWLSERSGPKIIAPATLGNVEFSPGAPAPGTYVFNK